MTKVSSAIIKFSLPKNYKLTSEIGVLLKRSFIRKGYTFKETLMHLLVFLVGVLCGIKYYAISSIIHCELINGIMEVLRVGFEKIAEKIEQGSMRPTNIEKRRC